MDAKRSPDGFKRSLRRGIGLTLFTWFLGISMVPLTIVSIIGYGTARQSLKDAAANTLAQAVELKADYIQAEFRNQLEDLRTIAKADSTLSLMTLLKHNRGNTPVSEFINSQAWFVISGVHGSDLENLKEAYGYLDIFLVDGQGNVVFSVQKKNELGTNIFEGIHANSKLSRACKVVLSQRRPVYSDIEQYGSKGELASFMVHPIVRAGQLFGVLVIQAPLTKIENMLRVGAGLGKTGRTYLVGDDRLIRAGSVAAGSRAGVIRRVDTKVVELWEEERLRKEEREKGPAQGQSPGEKASKAEPEEVAGPSRVHTYIGLLGRRVLGTWKPLEVLEDLGVRWALVAEIQAAEAFEEVNSLRTLVLCLLSSTGFLVLVIALLTTRRIVLPLRSLNEWAKSVTEGDLEDVEIKTPNNELRVLKENFAALTGSLRRARETRSRSDWVNKGISQLSDRMLEGNSISTLGRVVVRTLAEYVGAQVGRIYVVNDDKNLVPVGGFAVKKKDDDDLPLKPGQGLVGEVYRLRKPISLDDVPVGYLDVSSGLGAVAPNHLHVFPLVNGRMIKGVVELASLKEFTAAQLEFLELASQRIALAIDINLAWTKTTNLLEQTRAQAQKLQVQQEELRQTNEELEEQARALRQSEEVLQTQQEELRVTNEELEERTRSLEEQKEAAHEQNRLLMHAQAEIEEKAQALERASKYKSEFLANMSHELRTPLNSILILSQLLTANKDGNLTAKQKEFAETINTSGSDLLKLINEILDLSKVEAGRVEVNPEELVLTELAESLKKTFAQVAEDKGLEFAVELADDLPPAMVTDVMRLQQVLKNLLSNAFKFTEQGRVVLALGRPGKETDLASLGLEPDRAVAITVSDTGIGIPEDKQSLIFESFRQADGTTSRKYGGTGLGLAISKRLVELMGGMVSLESRVGHGTTFTVILPESISPETLPKAEVPENTEPAAPAQEISPADAGPATTEEIADDRKNVSPGDKTILVIEDDPKFAKILIDLAGEKGFKGLIAGDGEMGLHFADYYGPSAVILDITLPGMSGWEVMERLKENPKTRHIPVHFISAMDDSIDAMKMGAVGYLTKPVTSEQLDGAFDRIEDIITRKVKKILVVEDDPVQGESIKALVSAGDVETVLAATGEEALNLLKKETFDCLILDLGLADISGFDLLSKIRRAKSIPKFPIIVYTGREISEKEEAELQRYAESIIIKDVRSPERLLAETTLFLHRLEADLPQEQREMLKMVHSKESVLTGKKILVVDDDMRNVFALSSILEEKGIEVTMGRNGREGLDKLNDNPDTDLVLMDIMMPEMNGYEAMREIRKRSKYKDLPIIALTAKAMRGDRKKCIDAGANDYLAKPVDTGKLISLLRVWLYK